MYVLNPSRNFPFSSDPIDADKRFLSVPSLLFFFCLVSWPGAETESRCNVRWAEAVEADDDGEDRDTTTYQCTHADRSGMGRWCVREAEALRNQESGNVSLCVS